MSITANQVKLPPYVARGLSSVVLAFTFLHALHVRLMQAVRHNRPSRSPLRSVRERSDREKSTPLSSRSNGRGRAVLEDAHYLQ